MVSVSSFFHSYRGSWRAQRVSLVAGVPLLFLCLKHLLTSSSTWDPLITNEDEEMKDNSYHLLGDQSLTVVLSKIDFPFPSRGHMVIPKIFVVAVAMSVSKAAMRAMTGHPHARRSTSQQGITYPKRHQHQGSGPLVYFFCGLCPFLQNQNLFNTIMIFNKLQERQQS